jgi:hypothetical protein
VGCLWHTNLLIGDDGSVLNHHRKIVPTFYEKLVWANGDGAGLRACATRRDLMDRDPGVAEILDRTPLHRRKNVPRSGARWRSGPRDHARGQGPHAQNRLAATVASATPVPGPINTTAGSRPAAAIAPLVQAQAVVFSSTFFSSPLLYISIMMSEPPTNSPPT